MNLLTKTVIRGLYVSVAIGAFTAAPTYAQTADDSASEGEIVVTAQKRSERLLDVPVSVSAVTSDTLLQQNLVKIEDYATRIPGVSISSSRNFGIAIRGINAGGATNPTVAITIDDVPFGSSSALGNSQTPNLDPSDLQQIEVLRGPQGTLYGASSLGGLIKYVTREADPNEWSGRVEGNYSNARGGSDGWAVRGAVNVPLIDDKLGVRLSAYKRSDPKLGDRYNRTTRALVAEDINKSEYWGFRAAAFFRPIEALTFNVSHLEQTNEFTNSASTLIDRAQPLFTPLYGYFGNDSLSSFGESKTRLTQIKGELELGGVTLTSVSGWSAMLGELNADNTRAFSFALTGFPAGALFPGSPAIAPVYPAAPADAQVRLTDDRRTRKFSQEVRLSSNNDSSLKWILGGFYTNERSILDQEIYVSDAAGERIGSVVVFPLPSTYKEYAVFGDATYSFTEQFQVQVGARWSKNKQTYVDAQIVSPNASPLLFGVTRDGDLTRSKDDSVTWLISPSYKITPDMMVYARVATGYRPGGPNTAAAPSPDFDPDRVTNYELGFKGQLFDRMLTIDTAIFNIDWKDIQLQAQTATSLPFFTNGGKARSRGWEAAVELRPGNGWTFNGNLTLTDAELRDPLPVQPAPAPSLLGFKGDPLPYVAKFTGNLGFEKRWELGGDYSFALGGNYTHLGARNTLYRSSAAPLARQGNLRLPAQDVFDLRATLSGQRWDVTLFIRNLTNERGVLDAGDNQGTSSTLSATFIQPRTAGVTASYSF